MPLTERELRAGLASRPTNLGAVEALGHVLEEQGKVEDALIYYRKVLYPPPNAWSSSSDDDFFLKHYADLCESVGDKGEADKAYAHIARHGQFRVGATAPLLPAAVPKPGQERAVTAVRFAMHKYGDGDYEEAIREFDKALKVWPRDPGLRYYKGFSLQMLKRDAEAKKELELADSLGPDRDLQKLIRTQLSAYSTVMRRFEERNGKLIELPPTHVGSPH